VRGAIGRAAIHAEPLAPTRGRHAELEGLHDGGQLVRAITDLTAAAGPLVAAPYLDDRVIESVLAVRIDERLQPWSYKPLLRAVAADDLPRALAGREAKGVGTLDDALGLADGVAVLRQVFGESRLGDRGLIDAAAVCRLLDSPHAPHLQDGALLSTLAVEMWLRSREDVVPDDRMARTATTAAEDRIR
jgi:asparagine synthase (glutamine-hydrolysing)